MVYSTLGIDISKKKFDVALMHQGKIKHKTFVNNSSGFSEFRDWLNKRGVKELHACMEATSTYGEALAIYLFQLGFLVSVVNPAQIKAFAKSQLMRNKTDKADATLIAQFCLKFQPEPWQPTAPHRRELQALVHRLESLISLHNQETNRLETAHHIIMASLEKIITTLAEEIKATKKQIMEHIDKDIYLKQQRELLASIPGVGAGTIAQILAFIGDVSRFNNAKQLAAFVGLNPKQRQSGSSIRGRTSLSKVGNAALRKAFYMPALSAKRHNPIINQFCNRLKEKGKNGKAIICADMRKLLHIIYGVLKSRQPFNPSLTQ